MDTSDWLTADHARIRVLLGDAARLLGQDEREALRALGQLALALDLHDAVEDESLYPIVAESGHERQWMERATLAHAVLHALVIEAQSGLVPLDERLRLLDEARQRFDRHAIEEEQLFAALVAHYRIDPAALDAQLRASYVSFTRALAAIPARPATAATSEAPVTGLASTVSKPETTSRV